ncbi:hypothetical protein [Pseudoalteromonas phage C7]|uniref:hypothetical protein n=1 Tax=Pseudoalteromonas phage C7 TaxID=2510494 RepID=UPI001018029D|nr:hypothetical protein PP587_gp56 [Pseudoalteromonas phage C7]QAY18010.1 hypothetical protein [Pseudoalteromonas phage C7]
MFSKSELKSDMEKELFLKSISKVTEANLFAVFENISKDDIIKRVLADELYFSLSDRSVHIDDIEKELSQHNEVMLEVIREATTVKEQLAIFVTQAVDEVITDYEVPYVS